jgi:superfamily I DNA and RNA helicase
MSGTWWISDADLDEDQGLAIQGMSEDESFLIRGPAGSGKTNILLLRAKWLRLKDKSHFKIVVFTRTLRDFLRDGCEDYGIPRDRVVTANQFLRELLEEYDISFESAGSFEADRVLLAGKAQTLTESKDIKNIYDSLLIDECQDYLDTELLIFRRLTPRLILAADSRQSIYRSVQTPSLLENLVNNQVVTLRYHYRSGLKLCRVADGSRIDFVDFYTDRK